MRSVIMRLDLTATSLFRDDELNLEKDLNFIFGKNGTGKSTITNLIQNTKSHDYDVRVFQGFESVLGEDEKLNAVVLGEENKSINDEIKEKENHIKRIISEIEEIRLTISKPENIEVENFFTKHEKALKDLNIKKGLIDKIYTDSARVIAQNRNLVENARSYNKNVFKTEISKGLRLEIEEIERFEAILKSEKKYAKNIPFPKIRLEMYLNSINEILDTKVEAKIIIEELRNNPKKIEFAQTGIEIHSEGDKCAFCGSGISTERIDTLKSYFSADEVSALKSRIKLGKQKIEEQISILTELEIEIVDFYPDFIDSAKIIEKEVSDLKSVQLAFLKALRNSLEEKGKYLFERKEKLLLDIPVDFHEIEKKYIELVKLNSDFANNLIEKQRNAKQKLRYHEVKKLVDSFGLETEIDILDIFEGIVKNSKTEIEQEVAKIKMKETERGLIEKSISSLLEKTKNTKKIAENITKKLKALVTFELVRKEDGEQEFYEIKGVNGEIRPINELSTGEKNIIAFLYFIEKLNEVNDETEIKDRIIIFDDPMNSNDDAMQYLIIDELQKLMKRCKKSSNTDKFVLLTHNVFFYLNCSYEEKIGRDNKNPFDANNFYRLLSDNNLTKVVKIENKKQDFKTNYEALWHELSFLYDNDKPEMMLNPIRRIIETFIIFNGKEDFYKDNKDAKNLFNTNSHYFSDLEADLNGKTREEIKEMMKQCFRANGAENHFNKHWKNASGLIAAIG